jgi:CheY-like chemotaxis protein
MEQHDSPVFVVYYGGTMARHTALTLLIIDDDPSFLRALARLLRHDGHTVDTASNGHHALAHLQTQRYDLILCDLWMPELAGPDFYAILSRQYASLRQRVLFLTGDTLGAASTAFLAQCGQPCLYKPCTAAAVRHAIHQVLGAGAATGRAETMPEDGTLGIVRRGADYQVRYAANNPYADERAPHLCPNEDTLCAFLAAFGIEAEARQHACAVARQGRVAVLCLRATPAQIQTSFCPAPS